MLEILFEDYHVIAINKPPALLTQVAAGIPSLEAMVKEYLKAKYQKPGGVYLGIPHRLDRPVSGVVVFACNTKAAQRLGSQFQSRLVQKIYWGLVEGDLQPAEGMWTDWLRKLPAKARTELASEGEPDAKQAITGYRVLQRFGDRTLLELTPQTGRMHQLRIQSSSRGHPILGDYDYGGSRPFGPPAELPRDRIVALHARRLTVEHPTTHETLILEAPVSLQWELGSVEGGGGRVEG